MATQSSTNAARTTIPDEERRGHLREILDDAGTVMLVSRGAEGLHGRPMSLAKVDDDGTMYFATGRETGKVDELRADPRVDLFFQSKTRYAAVSGKATLSTDRALIHQLWSDAWKIWFPEGKDDPDIVIVVVDPERGEYWDNAGTRGLSYMYRAAKAYVTGTAMEPPPDAHGKVRM